MALSKDGGTVVIDWTAVAQGVVAVSSEFDVSESYSHMITIQAALDGTTKHDGTKFIIMVTAQDSGNEDWGVFETDQIGVELIAAAPLTENLTNNPLATAAVTLTMADTAGFETFGEAGLGLGQIPGWRLIEDATLINSELIYQTEVVGDTSITFANGTANGHVQNTPVYNIAISKVILLPDSASRVKVIVHNGYDADGSTLNYRVLGGKVTGV